jgi:microcystin-dependent protein
VSNVEGIVDVERRKGAAEYTLGDPTVFPPEFLSWLKRYIEQSGIQLPASSIFGTFSPGTGSVRNLTAGIVLPFAGPSPPPGSLLCQGQSVSRLTYPALFDAIGTTYGAVDINSFNLPDYRDRTLFGVGQTLTAVTQNDGQALANRGPKHRHTVTDPGHSHSGGIIGGVQSPPNGNLIVQDGSHNAAEVLGMGSSGTGVKVGPGPTTAPLDAPAYHAVNYVITTG